MVRTNTGFNERTYPSKGSLYQRYPRTLCDETDFESDLLNARAFLIKKQGRKEALKGLVRRTGKDSVLRPGSGGVKEREIMGARDAAKIRRTRKLLGIKTVERVDNGKKPDKKGVKKPVKKGSKNKKDAKKEKPKRKKSGLLVGEDSVGKWVIGEDSRRLLGLGVRESTTASGAGVVNFGKKEREERAAGELKMETVFWGGYRAVQFGL